MPAHVHAENMRLYAEDALETSEPWKRWEWYLRGVGWIQLASQPEWEDDISYRRKPKTIKVTVNDVNYEYPEPLKEWPLVGEDMFIVQVFISDIVSIRSATDKNLNLHWLLQLGFIHATKEGAEAYLVAFKAMSGDQK